MCDPGRTRVGRRQSGPSGARMDSRDATGDGNADRRWVRDVLRRHLGPGARVGDPTPFCAAGDGFASEMFSVETEDGPLVVKTLPGEPRRSARRLDRQFANEARFYGEVLPFLLGARAGEDDIIARMFPRFVCAHADPGRALVAVEDLRPRGFRLAPKTLDLVHSRLALRALGKFHALSLAAKRRTPAEFQEVVVAGAKHWRQLTSDELPTMMRECLDHAVQAYAEFFPEDKAGRAGDDLNRILGLVDSFDGSADPEEPLAVLCHGDFNRNNLLFGYGEDGVPTSLVLIDFQLATYCSPGVDLSLLLFLSASAEVRRLHWDELLLEYRTSLLETMQRLLGCGRDVLEKEYSAELFAEDFRRHCHHGFLIAIFFQPFLMLPPDLLASMDDGKTLGDVKSSVSCVMQNIGEEGRRSLGALVKDVIDKGYF
ncbi:uncharacterized protein LOC134532702 [Bacillus rossius redtenbacheri]|uniref:uncharacterized protein LOC134532702 n=1 Tax=Bacillus rossius redtenbacheri TaxID=93214 RepID=UPI002FDE56A4